MPKTEKPKGKEIIPYLTDRKKKLAKLFVENSSKSEGELIRAAGFSNNYSKQPSNLKKTKSWQKLMSKYVPEEDLAKKHKQLLNASNVIDSFIFPNSLSDAEIKTTIEKTPGCVFIRTKRNAANAHAYFYKPDNNTQFRSLELGYKLHKRIGGTDEGSGDGHTVAEFEAVVIRIRKLLPGSDE